MNIKSIKTCSFLLATSWPLIDVLSYYILQILLLVLLLQNSRWLVIINGPPLLYIILSVAILWIVCTWWTYNISIKMILRITLSFRREAILFTWRLMPYLTNPHTLQVLYYLIRWKIKRLLGDWIDLSGLGLGGRLDLLRLRWNDVWC